MFYSVILIRKILLYHTVTQRLSFQLNFWPLAQLVPQPATPMAVMESGILKNGLTVAE